MTTTYIHQDCLDRLNTLYAQRHHQGGDGQIHQLDETTRVSQPQAHYLGKLVRQHERRRTLEIGFAYGFSTLAILGGLKGRDGVSHISVDPYEETWWQGIGLQKVKEAECSSLHRWIDKPSHLAIPQLLEAGEKFDFAYIDGDHLFDATMLDVTLTQKVLDIGGIIAIDDLWMPSVQTVLSFMRTNLELQEIPSEIENLAVFRKVKEDDRKWWHFVPFQVDPRHGHF